MYHGVFRLLLFVSVLLPAACLRLDANLYNSDNSISEYKLEDYDGYLSFRLDSSFDISDPSKINLFTLQSNDNGDIKTIYALYIGDPSTIATDTVILYCHGNRDHMDFYWQRAKLLANAGGLHHFGVMMFDYRGYGLSAGEPSESGLYADTRAAIDWLADQGLTSDRLMMMGFSMGTAAAVKLSAEPYRLQPQKLILEAPFASADVMAQDGSLLDVPGSFFTNLEINNADLIRKVNQDLLWIHGDADYFLYMQTHGEVVYRNHPGNNKQAVRVRGAWHEGIPTTMGYSNYAATIADFIDNF